MAEAEILSVIEQLHSFLVDQKANYGSLTEKVEMLRNDLRLILDFLADKKLEEGSSLKYWISDVVEIARDAHLRTKNLLTRAIEPWPFFLLSESICRSLVETRKRILQLGAGGANKSSITSSSAQEGEEDYVVDLEEDVESMLHKPIPSWVSGRLYTICIVGMAGIGKTTLARKLYNHASVVDQYECRVWVCVGGEWSNKEVLMKLILEVLDYKDQSALLAEMENADNESLQRMLRQHLQGKRFFIVLDNVGEIRYSKSIFEALPEEDNNSVLVLTSRFRSTRSRVIERDRAFTFEIKPLDDDRSWQLFSKLLLFGNQEFPKKLEKKGREMLRSCAGLPLSIKEVATQFVVKRQGGRKWEELLLESIDLSVTLAVLESVYDRWPPELKTCFLCLSFFKKGTPLKREKLVHVWNAAQVIPYEDENEEEGDGFHLIESTMNHIATGSVVADLLEGYKRTLVKLLDESVIEIDISKTKRIKCIRIHDILHTLSMAKAEEEMVLETLKKGEHNPPSSREPRHRAIYCSRDEFNQFTDHDERLISLFFRGGGYFDATGLYWKRFEQLRTLDFEGFGLKTLPETIDALTELRYLGLRDNYIQELPQSLGRLKNLEVLDIALNFTVVVPDIVLEIDSLRHLYMSDIICRKPLKIDTLKNLETLTYISADNWTYEVSSLKMMTNLRKLGIEEVDEKLDVSKLFASLANLRNLECLILKGFRFRSLPPLHGLETLQELREIKLDGFITKLPSADIFPKKLTHLSLINSCLDKDPMRILAKLHYLMYLKLKNAYTGQQMVMFDKFSNLRILCIEELWHLRSIRVDYYVPLAKLEIRSCPYLESFPKNLTVVGMNEMNMSTTKQNAAKIRKLDYISKINHVNIQP